MSRVRRSYANVTSTLALVIAAAGGTALAVGGGNADKVDGLNAAKIDYVVKAKVPPTPFKTIFSQGGLVLRARCIEESGHFMDLIAKSKQNNAEIQVSVTSGTPAGLDRGFDRDFDRGDQLDIGGLPTGSQGEATLTYSTRKGSHVSAVFQMDVGSIFGGSGVKPCLVGGTALHVPA